MRPITDPVELCIANALTARGVAFRDSANGLDFYLPDLDVHIECKQFHTPRIVEQMSRVNNIIVVQGMAAALAFAHMLTANPSEQG